MRFILFISFILFLSCSNNNENLKNNEHSPYESISSDLNQTLNHSGQNRSYLLYIPDSYVDSIKYPILMNFHGGGGDAQSQLYISDMRSLANTENFILVYPNGSDNIESGGRIWNTLLPSDFNKTDADDFGFIAAIIDDIDSNFNIDTTRVYATGYSNGGGFAYSLACYLSNKIAAVAPVSGLMWDEAVEQCNPTHPTSLISFNGTSDFERPYNGMDYMSSVNEILNYWVEFNDTDSIPIITSFQSSGLETEHYIYESGLNNVSIEHYKFINGGHHWFEMDNDGLNIDEIIWNFVSKYDLNGLIE